MATRITFIIRDDEAGLDPSTYLDTVQQMLTEQMDRYCLGDNFDEDDVMVEAHPEGAPVDETTEADLEAAARAYRLLIDAGAKGQRNEAAELARDARAFVEGQRAIKVGVPDTITAHRLIVNLADAIETIAAHRANGEG